MQPEIVRCAKGSHAKATPRSLAFFSFLFWKANVVFSGEIQLLTERRTGLPRVERMALYTAAHTIIVIHIKVASRATEANIFLGFMQSYNRQQWRFFAVISPTEEHMYALVYPNLRVLRT